MNHNKTKISKCGSRRCRTCPYIIECNSFVSTNNHSMFYPILGTAEYLTCSTENIVYLISCQLCNNQYVGESKNSIQKRFSSHRSSIRNGKSNQLIHNHFHIDCHGLDNCRIIPIEKIEAPGLNEKEITRYRLDREKHWIITLQTCYPLGLNERFKGLGDFTPSQGRYPDFGGRRRRNKRSHGKRKPKRLRPIHNATLASVIAQHQTLKNSTSYTHYFKTYLYGLPKRQLLSLWTEISRPDDTTESWLKDIITMIVNLRLFRPVTKAEIKKRDYYHLNFIDKGLDRINLGGILCSPSVQAKIPSYFHDQEPPIIAYIYNPSIAGLIFNYKKALDPEYVSSIDTNNIVCDCANSIYKDPHHGHIVTGDLGIIQNESLRNLLKKGPKYRLPRKINWAENRENILQFLEKYIKKWTGKERKESGDRNLNENCLKNWIEEVLRLVDKRISRGKIHNKDHSHYIKGIIKDELDKLHTKYVLTPADKAQNNILFTCKPFYVKITKDELSPQNNQTYHLSNLTFNQIINQTCIFSENLGIPVNDRMKDLPIIYWIPKMHKNPTSQRFIAGSKCCSIKNLSKLFSKSLKLMLNHLVTYYKVVFNRSGLKHYWIIDNSIDFLENIRNKKITHLETYDFSTLYTSLPHTEIKSKFRVLFRTIFNREGKQFINVNQRKAFFSNSHTNSYKSLTELQLFQILEFILDNIFVKFGNDMYKQIIGIPIGLDSGQDIANLLLFQYESSYIERISKRDMVLARKFSLSDRYIDDLSSLNFPDFRQHLPNIYPPELIINLSSDSSTNVNYLDLNMKIDNNFNLETSVYDKRDDFNFKIVNFPYLDSCIPRKPALGIFLSQLIRYARICSGFQDFSHRSLILSKRLQNQGYQRKELRKLLIRFFHERGSLLEKYNQRDINFFLSKTLFI